MNYKLISALFLIILVAVSLSQVFNIYPHAEDVYPIYRSGYFSELEEKARIIAESYTFLRGVDPDFADVYIDDIEKRYGIRTRLYSASGASLRVRDAEQRSVSTEALKAILNPGDGAVCGVRDGLFVCNLALPVSSSGGIVHGGSPSKPSGVLEVMMDYDTGVYYSRERILLFTLTTALLIVALIILVRWRPYDSVKEIFDK